MTAEARAEEARIEEANKGNTSKVPIDTLLQDEFAQVRRRSQRQQHVAVWLRVSGRTGHLYCLLWLAHCSACQVLLRYADCTSASRVSPSAESKALAVSRDRRKHERAYS